MKIKTIFFILILFVSNTLTGQSLNEYEYVIIPSKYDFQKTEDQYQLNSLSKFLFEKEGFKTIYNNLELPSEISNNPCSALTARINNESNMFTTKLVIELVNCKNQKVLISHEGRSKEKNYKKGYQEAIREAFESITAQNYNYTGTEKTTNVIATIEDAKVEVKETLEKVVEEVVEVEEVEEVVEVEVVKEPEQAIEVEEAIELEEIDQGVDTKPKANTSLNILYAQANTLGYQLVDSTPKVMYVLLNSSKKDVFLLKDKSGMVYKQNDTWFVEYYNENELVKKPLNIKF